MKHNLRTILVPTIMAGLVIQLGVYGAAVSHDGAGASFGAFIVGIVTAYWLPTLVAYLRQMSNVAPIALVNGLLGWSGVGWVVALVMACSQRVTVNVAR